MHQCCCCANVGAFSIVLAIDDVFLTCRGSKNPLPSAVQRELEAVVRCIKTALLDISNAAGRGATDHALREIRLLVPLADAAAVIHATPFETVMEYSLLKAARAAYTEAFGW